MSRMIDANTVLLGLLASPCRHSISPAMHNAAFDKLGINYAYLSFDVDTDTIKGAVDAIRVLKMRGANVSMPNKRAVVQYMDKLSPAAEIIQAVNTIVNDDGILTGHNTDGIGFVQSLIDEGIEVKGKSSFWPAPAEQERRLQRRPHWMDFMKLHSSIAKTPGLKMLKNWPKKSIRKQIAK